MATRTKKETSTTEPKTTTRASAKAANNDNGYISSEEALRRIREKEVNELRTKGKEFYNTHKKIGIVKETPYCGVPDVNSNVVGFLQPPNTYIVYDEIISGDDEKGSFWDIGGGRFINKDWEVHVFE